MARQDLLVWIGEVAGGDLIFDWEIQRPLGRRQETHFSDGRTMEKVERRTDEKLSEPDESVEVGQARLANKSVLPAQLSSTSLEMTARHLSTLAGVQVEGRGRAAGLQQRRVDTEELRMRTCSRSESAENGDMTLRIGMDQLDAPRERNKENTDPFLRSEGVDVDFEMLDSTRERSDAGKLRATCGGCGWWRGWSVAPS